MLRFSSRYRCLTAFRELLQPLPTAQEIQKQQLHTHLLPHSATLVSTRTKVWSSKLHLPKDDRTVDVAIYEALESHTMTNANRQAILYAGDPKTSLTFSDMKKSIQALEVFLYNIGFKKGDVASVLLPNCIEYPVILAAILSRGGVASTAAPLLTEFEIKLLLEGNESNVIFVADTLLPQVIAAAKNNKHITSIVVIRFTEQPVPTGVISWNTVMEINGNAPKVKTSPDDLAFLPYSSGTTGIPKGVMLTHRNFLTSIRAVSLHMEKEVVPKVFAGICEKETQEKMLSPVGATIAHLPKFDPIVFLTALQTIKPWELALVPPVGLFLAKNPVVANFDLSSIKWILNGAAPLPEEVGLGLRNRIKGVNVTQGYGLTETVALTTLPSSMEALTSVGVVAPGAQLKIVGKDGKELGANEKGEVAVHGENVMKGYHRNEKETKNALRNGWFYTGDIGYMDENDHLYIVDRIKELIKVKGLQVAPALLEAQLIKNPRITDAAVVGVPHEEFGEVPRAYVVKADPTLTEEDVKKTIADQLAKHNWLEGGVVFVKEIPKSSAGKILRRLLK